MTGLRLSARCKVCYGEVGPAPESRGPETALEALGRLKFKRVRFRELQFKIGGAFGTGARLHQILNRSRKATIP